MAYRVGIVGTGGIARAHGNACKGLKQVELRAICDVSADSLERFGNEFGVQRRYLRLEEMLHVEDLDIVIISTWGVYHAETSKQVARSRRVKAILCEKPFSSNASEAQEMVSVAREHGVLIAEAFKFRHHPQHLKTDEIVQSGAIGNIKAIRSTFHAYCHPDSRKPEKNWRFNLQQGGGSIYDLGCYCIHHARFVLHAEPVRVFAVSQPGIEVDEAAAILIEFPGPAAALISVGFSTYGCQYAEISGTSGMIRIEQAWNNENQPVTLQVNYTNGNSDTYRLAATDQFALQLRHLCECLDTSKPHRIPPENSIGQMKVMDAVFESFRTHRPVELG